MISLREIRESFLHLLFPHICAGCGRDIIHEKTSLCIRCMNLLPETNFERFTGNPVEKMFWGRLQLTSATAQFYFTKESMMQRLMHQLKYKSHRELGLQLGRLMGQQLLHSGRIIPDALIPLPLFPAREKRRGYNQATVLCEGIAEVMKLPVLDKVIIRPQHTETQTKKGRVERWKNMEGKFVLIDPASVQNKHLLLIDDVITTGATLEACGHELLNVPGIELSVATLCIATR
jgi:ComF family protein